MFYYFSGRVPAVQRQRVKLQLAHRIFLKIKPLTSLLPMRYYCYEIDTNFTTNFPLFTNEGDGDRNLASSLIRHFYRYTILEHIVCISRLRHRSRTFAFHTSIPTHRLRTVLFSVLVQVHTMRNSTQSVVHAYDSVFPYPSPLQLPLCCASTNCRVQNVLCSFHSPFVITTLQTSRIPQLNNFCVTTCLAFIPLGRNSSAVLVQ